MDLLKLLTFPVSAPLAGGRWVLQTVLDEAERRYYDTAVIQDEMAEAERSHRSGAIDDETFDRWEEALLLRLLEAREYHQRKRPQSPAE